MAPGLPHASSKPADQEKLSRLAVTIALLFFLSLLTQATHITAQVIHITDGDTIKIPTATPDKQQIKVRRADIRY